MATHLLQIILCQTSVSCRLQYYKNPYFNSSTKLGLQRKILKSSFVEWRGDPSKDGLYLDLNLVRIGVKKCQNNQKMFVIMASCEKKSQFWRHCILGSLICLVFYLINIFIFIFQFYVFYLINSFIFIFQFYVFYYMNILCSCIGGQPKQYLASIGENFVEKCEKNSTKFKKNVKMLGNLSQKLNFPSRAGFTLRW